MRWSLQRSVSKAYAQKLAMQPLPQGFRAPDRSRPEYQFVQATFTVTTTTDSGPSSLREARRIAFDIDGGGTCEELAGLCARLAGMSG